MTYRYVCMPDAEEGVEITSNNMRFCNAENKIEQVLVQISAQHPTSTLCVYELRNMLKLKSKPVYAKYKVADNGEIIPE